MRRVSRKSLKEGFLATGHAPGPIFHPASMPSPALHPVDDRRRRRALGAFYTPRALVDLVLDATLQPVIADALARAHREGRSPGDAILALRVLDPSCGDGAFLVPAAERLIAAAHRAGVRGCGREIVERCVVGTDIDANAAATCGAALRSVAGSCAAVRVGVADALARGPDVFDESFDVVVGNPPYLNQLETATVATREVAARVREWSGGRVKGYADAAAAFWMLSVMRSREDGRVGLVLPSSVLSTRDASEVRGFVARRASLESLWFSRERVFDACVEVCAPVVRVGGDRVASVRRSAGLAREPLRTTRVDMDALADEPSWSRLLPVSDAIPWFETPGGVTLGEIATATADFRDQYYGLEGRVLEDADARRLVGDERELERRFPRLITSGLIEPGECLWGVRQTRVHKRRWRAPRVDRERVERETTLGSWMRARLVPKVLLATQTRVLECVTDERGEWLPCVPVITLTPRQEFTGEPDALRRIAEALSSPVATAFALREFGGAALSADAIKLSARQAMSLPLGAAPVDGALASWHALRRRATGGAALLQ